MFVSNPAFHLREPESCILLPTQCIIIRGIATGNAAALLLLWLQHRYGFLSLDPANYFVTQIPVHIDWIKLAVLNVVSAVLITLILYIPSVFIAGVEPDKSLRVK